jgi:hypothetical protein
MLAPPFPKTLPVAVLRPVAPWRSLSHSKGKLDPSLKGGPTLRRAIRFDSPVSHMMMSIALNFVIL